MNPIMTTTKVSNILLDQFHKKVHDYVTKDSNGFSNNSFIVVVTYYNAVNNDPKHNNDRL